MPEADPAMVTVRALVLGKARIPVHARNNGRKARVESGVHRERGGDEIRCKRAHRLLHHTAAARAVRIKKRLLVIEAQFH